MQIQTNLEHLTDVRQHVAIVTGPLKINGTELFCRVSPHFPDGPEEWKSSQAGFLSK